jgi:hypothetical protein
MSYFSKKTRYIYALIVLVLAGHLLDKSKQIVTTNMTEFVTEKLMKKMIKNLQNKLLRWLPSSTGQSVGHATKNK